ncbi:MAG: exonuclease domain-containing protein [Myxococcota bacterium]
MALYSLSFKEIPVVAFDLETTGLRASHDKICEIGAVLSVQQREIAHFQSLINPQQEMPPEVIKIHNITPHMLQHAPCLEEILPSFLLFVRSALLVGHNIGFDLSFLARAARHWQYPIEQHVQIDTVRLASVLFPNLRSYALSSLAKTFQLPRYQAHRALEDAQTTLKLFERLQQQLQTQGIHSLTQLQRTYPQVILNARSSPRTPKEQKLWHAMQHQLLVYIEYTNAKGNITQRQILPERFTPPYLYAYCFLRKEHRSFRIQRIQSAQLSKTQAPPHNFP